MSLISILASVSAEDMQRARRNIRQAQDTCMGVMEKEGVKSLPPIVKLIALTGTLRMLLPLEEEGALGCWTLVIASPLIQPRVPQPTFPEELSAFQHLSAQDPRWGEHNAEISDIMERNTEKYDAFLEGLTGKLAGAAVQLRESGLGDAVIVHGFMYAAMHVVTNTGLILSMAQCSFMRAVSRMVEEEDEKIEKEAVASGVVRPEIVGLSAEEMDAAISLQVRIEASLHLYPDVCDAAKLMTLSHLLVQVLPRDTPDEVYWARFYRSRIAMPTKLQLEYPQEFQAFQSLSELDDRWGKVTDELAAVCKLLAYKHSGFSRQFTDQVNDIIGDTPSAAVVALSLLRIALQYASNQTFVYALGHTLPKVRCVVCDSCPDRDTCKDRTSTPPPSSGN